MYTNIKGSNRNLPKGVTMNQKGIAALGIIALTVVVTLGVLLLTHVAHFPQKQSAPVAVITVTPVK